MNVVDMLEDLGHVVVPAGSGKEALQRLGERKFNLLVTDHAMPQMTGAQLVAQARARCPELAVILATGYAELPPGVHTDIPRLSKPFSQADLAAALSEAMRASAAPATVMAAATFARRSPAPPMPSHPTIRSPLHAIGLQEFAHGIRAHQRGLRRRCGYRRTRDHHRLQQRDACEHAVGIECRSA